MISRRPLYGKVARKDGKAIIQWDDQRDYDRTLTLLLGKTVVVEIDISAGRRTDAQNRRYRRVLAGLADYTGYSEKQVEEILEHKFLGYRRVLPSGELAQVTQQAEGLCKPAFGLYLDQCEEWGMELGCEF